MDIKEFLQQATQVPGLVGYEGDIGRYVKEAFAPLSDDVRMDALGNVIARFGQQGPRILVTAHQDEIGLMVLGIEEDGCLRVHRVGGVDPRILPGAEVVVHAKSGLLPGVVGAKAPHLIDAKERKKALTLPDLYVDIGMSAERVRECVRVGDQVRLTGEMVELSDGNWASKTMDDRAGIACMLSCLLELHKMRAPAQTLFLSASQEEISSGGVMTAGYALDPDLAIAIDVTHGEGPGTGKLEGYPLDKVVLGMGPSLHPEMLERIRQTAKKHHIDCMVEVSAGRTWTDGDPLHLVRAGVPTILVQIPLRYMHTTVETLSGQTIHEAGRLIALFIDEISRDWEAIRWF